MYENRVILMGNLTRDPELKFLMNQTAVCNFGLAMNRKWLDGQGNKMEDVTYVDCTLFGETGKTLHQYVRKGSPLYVTGRLRLEQWKAQDGTPRQKLTVVVERFQFVGARKDAAPAGEKPADAAGDGGTPDGVAAGVDVPF